MQGKDKKIKSKPDDVCFLFDGEEAQLGSTYKSVVQTVAQQVLVTIHDIISILLSDYLLISNYYFTIYYWLCANSLLTYYDSVFAIHYSLFTLYS